MYLPGFPAIAQDLNTSIDVVQLSLTSYFIGIAAGQLLYGPLLDRFGRKTPLYAGLSIYVVTSIGCAFIHSPDALITMRFLQAVGGCAGMVAAQTLVRDLFPVEKTAQAFSWITLVIAISPMVAPAVGSYVAIAFGWQAIFLILAGLAMLLIAGVYFALPDGRGGDRTLSLQPKPVLNNFITVIRQPQFLLYTLAGGIATSAPFAYIAGSADVFMNVYGVLDLAAGHGLLGTIMLILDDSSAEAIAVDTAVPPCSSKVHEAVIQQWRRLSGRVKFEASGLDGVEVAAGDVVVSSHACGALTDRILDRASQARARLAVLPCCHDLGTCDAGGLTGWLEAAVAIDAMRAVRLRERGYRIWTQTIPATITPQNRLLLGEPLA
jgi:multidrug resistance protein